MNLVEERKLLRDLYPNTPNAEIAKRLCTSVGMVAYKARFLGLKKDPKYLSEVNRKSGSHSSVSRYWKSLHES